MSDQSIETIELSIDHSKQLISRKASLEKLIKNREFKTIILEGYFEKEAQRLVMLKSDPNMQSDESQKEIIKHIDSIGLLRQYFNGIRVLGNQAEKALVADEATKEEMLEEDLNV